MPLLIIRVVNFHRRYNTLKRLKKRTRLLGLKNKHRDNCIIIALRIVYNRKIINKN